MTYQPQQCTSCNLPIKRAEWPRLWQNAVVCQSCYAQLSQGMFITPQTLPVAPPQPKYAPQSGQLQTCGNCGYIIGKLVTPMIWKDQIVCESCHQKLTAVRTSPIASTVSIKPTTSSSATPSPKISLKFGSIKWVAGIVVGILISYGIIAFWHKSIPTESEPTFNGKPWSEWVKLSEDKNYDTYHAALIAISRFKYDKKDEVLAIMRNNLSSEIAREVLWGGTEKDKHAVLGAIESEIKDGTFTSYDLIKKLYPHPVELLPYLIAASEKNTSEKEELKDLVEYLNDETIYSYKDKWNNKTGKDETLKYLKSRLTEGTYRNDKFVGLIKDLKPSPTELLPLIDNLDRTETVLIKKWYLAALRDAIKINAQIPSE